MKICAERLKMGTPLLSVALMFPSFAFAQHGGAGQGYVFASVGNALDSPGDTKIGVGGGFERLLFKGIGAGAEIQAFGVKSRSNGYGGLLVTVNGSYHLQSLIYERKLVPFLTAGYSGLAACSSSECGEIAGYNFGAGVNYWLKRNRGLRLEVRDHVFRETRSIDQLWELRVGFAF